MNSEQGSMDQGKELIRMWQESALPGPVDAGQLARAIAARVEGFDRKIRWRNLREYAAGAVLIAWFLWQAVDPARRPLAMAGMVAVGFVVV